MSTLVRLTPPSRSGLGVAARSRATFRKILLFNAEPPFLLFSVRGRGMSALAPLTPPSRSGLRVAARSFDPEFSTTFSKGFTLDT